MYIDETIKISKQNIYYKSNSSVSSNLLKTFKTLKIKTENVFLHKDIYLRLVLNQENNYELHPYHSEYKLGGLDLVTDSETELLVLLRIDRLSLNQIFENPSISLCNKCRIFYYNYKFKDLKTKIAFWEKIRKIYLLGFNFLTNLIIEEIDGEFISFVEPYYYEDDTDLYYIRNNNLGTIVSCMTLKSDFFEKFVIEQLSEYYKYKPENSRLDLIWFGYRFNEDNQKKRLEVLDEIIKYLKDQLEPEEPEEPGKPEEPEEPGKPEEPEKEINVGTSGKTFINLNLRG